MHRLSRFTWFVLAVALIGSVVAPSWVLRPVRAQDATPAGVEAVESAFPAGTMTSDRAEAWLALFTLAGGSSAPYPGAGINQPGVAVLSVESGRLELSGGQPFHLVRANQGSAASPAPRSATTVLEAGDTVALAFGPDTAFELRNLHAGPARFVNAFLFGGASPASGPPGAYGVLAYAGPLPVTVPQAGAPVVRLEQRVLEAKGEVPVPDEGTTQLAISGMGMVVMHQDGSAENGSGRPLDTYVLTIQFDSGAPATPAP